MKISTLKTILILLLSGVALPASAQVDIKVYQPAQGAYVSLDTLTLTIDTNDNSGTGATTKTIFFNIYNLSATHAEAFYLDAEWLCSNSSAFYQFCQEYPPDFTTGTCHMFHREGTSVYDDYNYTVPADTCSYNYLKCHFFIYDYSVEKEHEKVCRFRVRRRNTNEILDSMCLVIRRGHLPCNQSQPSDTTTSIPSVSIDQVADIYPIPARSSFTIAARKGQPIRYALYAPDGRTLLDRSIENGKQADIRVADLPNGIYYLKLVDNRRQSFFRKIVVAH